jgi:putative membrane protein
MSTPEEHASSARKLNSNRTRDHLANERTYLAWVRTAVALLGFGVVIVRLRYMLPSGAATQSHGWELGLLMAIVAVLLVIFATAHYFYVRNAIEADSYEPSGRWIIACSFVLTLIGAGIIFYLVNSLGFPPSVMPHSTMP